MATMYSKEDIQATFDKFGDKATPRFRKLAEEALEKIQNGMELDKALNFTPKIKEAIYEHAYNLYKGGKYKTALSHFLFLRNLDPVEYKYSFAIAACHQRMEEYSFAAANYIICRYIDPLNPLPSFHLYDCFLKMNEYMSALAAIQETIALAEQDSRYDTLKEKVLLEYKAFKKDLKKFLVENYGNDEDKKNFNYEEEI